MRVTIVTETYFPQVNGVSRTLTNLVQTLENKGDSVQLLHPDYHQPPLHPWDYLARAVNPPFYRELSLPVPPFTAARKAIDHFQPDIVHIATEATLGLSCLRHALHRRLPLVSSFHTNFDQYADHYRVGFCRGAVWRYLRWFHNRTLETYVPSLATIADLQNRRFQRLVLWPRGVDNSLFRPDRPGRDHIRRQHGIGPTDVVIGHVSRIAAEKNIAYLALALEQVVHKRPEVRLLIVGDGPARSDLQARLGSAAVFAGYRSGEDLADHYAACDVFAFASLTETFGNVILEAMASGLPVVAIRAGGPGDTVQHNHTGFLVEPNEPPDSFAASLLRLATDTTLRHNLAAQARSYACSQSWEAIMSTLRQRYLAIIGQVQIPLNARTSGTAPPRGDGPTTPFHPDMQVAADPSPLS